MCIRVKSRTQHGSEYYSIMLTASEVLYSRCGVSAGADMILSRLWYSNKILAHSIWLRQILRNLHSDTLAPKRRITDAYHFHLGRISLDSSVIRNFTKRWPSLKCYPIFRSQCWVFSTSIFPGYRVRARKSYGAEHPELGNENRKWLAVEICWFLWRWFLWQRCIANTCQDMKMVTARANQ